MALIPPESAVTLVSVVIPTVGRPALLRRAVESVTAQTHEPIELLVVGSQEAAEIGGYLDSVDVSRAEFVVDPAASPAAARNVGINRAEGKYVAFLDDDDTWDAPKIEKQLRRVAATDVEASHTGLRNVGPDGTVHAVTRPTAEGDLTRDIIEFRVLLGNLSVVLVSREVARRVGGFDERFHLLEDGDFYLRVAQETDFCAVPEPLVTKYTGDHEQVTGNLQRRLIDEERFIQKHEAFAGQLGDRTKQRMISYLKFDTGMMAASHGQYDVARERFVSALRHEPTRLSALMWLALTAGGSATFKPAQYWKRKLVGVVHRMRSRR